MPQFLVLSPLQPPSNNPVEAFYEATTSANYNNAMNSQMDTGIYDAEASRRCCAACRCYCRVGGCKNVDTGQAYAVSQNHVYMVTEAFKELMNAPSSEDSLDAAGSVDPESCAPGPCFAAPSISLLDHSPARRTVEEWCTELQPDYEERMNANPFEFFTSQPEESNQSFDDADMLGMQGASESTMATPGISSSSISLSAGWPSLYQQDINSSIGELAGVGFSIEDNTISHLSTSDGR